MNVKDVKVLRSVRTPTCKMACKRAICTLFYLFSKCDSLKIKSRSAFCFYGGSHPVVVHGALGRVTSLGMI
jgi:hypothetical protein